MIKVVKAPAGPGQWVLTSADGPHGNLFSLQVIMAGDWPEMAPHMWSQPHTRSGSARA